RSPCSASASLVSCQSKPVVDGACCPSTVPGWVSAPASSRPKGTVCVSPSAFSISAPSSRFTTAAGTVSRRSTRPLSAHMPRPTTSSGSTTTTMRVRGWDRRFMRGLLEGRRGGALDGQGAQAVGGAQRAVQMTFGVDRVRFAGADDHRGTGLEQGVEALDEHVGGGGGVSEAPAVLDDDDGAVQATAADRGEALGHPLLGADPLGAGLDRG